MTHLSLSLVGAAAMLATVSAASSAQKSHGGGSAHMPAHVAMPHADRPAKMDHASATGEVHEAAKADKVPANEMKREASSEDRSGRLALRDAHDQSSHLLKGVRLTAAERRQVKAIDKKYDAQLKALKKDEKAADKTGGIDNDAAYEQKIAALAAQERTDLRAVLPAAQQARYDANVAARLAAKR